MSLDWDSAGSWLVELLEAYGIEGDAERIAHYRRLWDSLEIGGG
ncbi:hypothetical protein [Mycolicibacterium confluentis]|nr:hypothetical protein [Mycolicibacterium confluentis]